VSPGLKWRKGRDVRATAACLDVAVALGYVEQVDRELLSQLDQVRAMLASLVR
jgi:hypothetical protein